MMKPFVHEYLDTMAYSTDFSIQLEELELLEGSTVVGKTLQESAIRKLTGATILAVKKPGGRIATNPPVSSILRKGDRLILVGTTEQLERAYKIILPT